MTCQFHIKQFGLQGNGAGVTSAAPFQLIFRILSTSAASERNVYVGDYATLAAAKTGAVAGVGYVIGGTTGNTTPVLDTTSGTWTDNAAGSESLSATFTMPF
jgi:hypothetical protein